MATSQAVNTTSSIRVWLVTGCSSGLGRELVSAILARGDKVIATARRISDLDYLKSIDGEPYNVLQGKLEKGIEHFGSIDVLVNNSGFLLSGVWEETSHEETSRQFETNFFDTMKVTRCILPYFRKAKSGVIMFMGSIGGWFGVAAGGPYSASKFALEGAAECLAKETAHLGIRTHIVVLGQFRTQIISKRGGDLTGGIPEYESIKTGMANRYSTSHGKQPGDPEAAAQRIVDIARLENLTEHEKQKLPLRIPLGVDAIGVVRKKCTETLESLQGWEEFAASTNFKDGSAVYASYR